MKLVCPNCHSAIGAENVNVATDLAKCTMCNEIFKASELSCMRCALPAARGVVAEHEDKVNKLEGEAWEA